MKKISIILLFFTISIFSKDNISTLENIVVSNKNQFIRIILFFDLQTEFTSQKFKDHIEIGLNNIKFSQSFPASEFKIQSEYLSDILFNRESNTKVSLKLFTNEGNDYSIIFLKDSKSLMIDIFNPLKLNVKDRMFRNALKLQSEGKLEQALRDYRKLSSENYETGEMNFFSGIIRESLGYLYQAKSNFNNAINQKCEIVDVNARLANISLKLDQKENAIVEQKKFDDDLLNLKNSKLDLSLAQILKPINTLLSADSLMLAQTDSNKNLASKNNQAINKPLETKIVKSEPINNNSYYMVVASYFVIIVVAIAAIIIIWLFIRKGEKRKIKNKSKEKEIITPTKISRTEKTSFEGLNLINNSIKNEPVKKVYFDDYLNEYKKNESKEKSATNSPKMADDEKIELVKESENSEENLIEKLAKKYQIEQEKIELALKMISKNKPGSSTEKYELLEKMLRDKMSIDEIATQLRIPKGEIDLISQLNHI